MKEKIHTELTAQVTGQTYLFKASVHMLVVLSVLFCMCGYDVIEVSQSSKMAVLAGSAVGGAKLCT